MLPYCLRSSMQGGPFKSKPHGTEIPSIRLDFIIKFKCDRSTGILAVGIKYSTSRRTQTTKQIKADEDVIQKSCRIDTI